MYRICLDNDKKDLYMAEETKIRRIFIMVELAPFLELIHHMVNI
jgi:hypothetical protein